MFAPITSAVYAPKTMQVSYELSKSALTSCCSCLNSFGLVFLGTNCSVLILTGVLECAGEPSCTHLEKRLKQFKMLPEARRGRRKQAKPGQHRACTVYNPHAQPSTALKEQKKEEKMEFNRLSLYVYHDKKTIE